MVDYRLLRLLHVQALSLLILLLVLISPRVMSGQVRLYSYILTKVWIYEECSSVINRLNLVFDILGKNSFNRRSLHHIGRGLNPYEQAISIIGKSLAAFDEDNLIPCFGFGDGISLNNLT